ncbi:MAG: purine-nucleoside phosphorylase [Deltaproteobacteria bacterium]|nr:purine-nucleoside phosphorylase [Deltaproteobacteria bacterium]
MVLIHVAAKEGQVAPWVLLPGDPNRARQVAEKHLDGAKRYSEVRQMWGYTGTYQGEPVSVQATGMGGPSTAIILEELVRLGAKAFVRIGTCGCLQDDLALGTLLGVTAASATGNLVKQVSGVEGYAPVSDFGLQKAMSEAGDKAGSPLLTGPVASMDLFYDKDTERIERLRALGVLALEMEAATVFTLAAKHALPAACLLAVSDCVSTGERIGDRVLKESVDRMVQVALQGLIDWGRRDVR